MMQSTSQSSKPRQNAPLQDILDYYGSNGFWKTSAESYADLLIDDIVDGTLALVDDSGGTYISHHGAFFPVSKYDLRMFTIRKLEGIEVGDVGNYFMLYNLLVDLLKIDRFDLADVKHDELFNLAHKKINELSN